MERQAGINAEEKKRLRDAIQNQVRQYLARGGSITVIQAPQGAPVKAAPGGVWNSRVGDSADFIAQFD